MTNLTQRARDVAGRLLDPCLDWDGSTMGDGAEPRRIPSCGELRDAAAIISELVERIEGVWQDIETAPKDGTQVLVCWPLSEMWGVVAWMDGGWFEGDDDSECGGMTHWMPLPPPPSVLGKQEGEG